MKYVSTRVVVGLIVLMLLPIWGLAFMIYYLLYVLAHLGDEAIRGGRKFIEGFRRGYLKQR